MIRSLLWTALVLAFIVLAASSALRLSANGLSCAPWPACYGQPATAETVRSTEATRALRALHRVAAGGFGLVALALTIGGWRRFSRGERTAAALLLAVTLGLAWLGRHTPSAVPAVTVVNVWGGLALIGLLGWLLASASGRRSRGAIVVALGLALAMQAAGGALISARLAATACLPLCEHAWLPGAAALWHPARAGSAVEIVGHPQAGQPLVALHALAGIGVLIAMLLGAAALAAGRAARRLALAAATTGATGFGLYALDSPLGLAVIHAALAGGLAAALAACAPARRSA